MSIAAAAPQSASTHPAADAAELELFRDNVRRFLAAKVEPHYEKWEKAGIVPRELYRELGEAGLLCVDLPEEYGGIGASFEFSMVVVAEAARMGFMALASNLTVHSDIAAPYVLHLGTEAQKKHWLPKMASGEVFGAIAMTEPGAGSDLQGIKTTALADGDGYVINGSKGLHHQWPARRADRLRHQDRPQGRGQGHHPVPGGRRPARLQARPQPRQDRPAQRRHLGAVLRRRQAAGQRGAGPRRQRLRPPGGRAAARAPGRSRGLGGPRARRLGEDHRVRDHARKAFYATLASFQNTRFEIGAHEDGGLEVVQAFIDKCVGLYRQGKLDVPTGAIWPSWPPPRWRATRLRRLRLQLFGGYGYMTEYPISRYWSDARIQRIYGGTTEMMKEVIARSVVGRADA